MFFHIQRSLFYMCMNFKFRWLWWCSLCTRPTWLIGFDCASSLKQQSTGRKDTLFWFRDDPSLLFLINAAFLCGEVTNTNFIDYGLTRPQLEPTMYCIRGKCTNHYIITPPTRLGSWGYHPHNSKGLFYTVLCIYIYIS